MNYFQADTETCSRNTVESNCDRIASLGNTLVQRFSGVICKFQTRDFVNRVSVGCITQ